MCEATSRGIGIGGHVSHVGPGARLPQGARHSLEAPCRRSRGEGLRMAFDRLIG